MLIGFDRTQATASKKEESSTKKAVAPKTPKSTAKAEKEDVNSDAKNDVVEEDDDDDFNVKRQTKDKKLLYIAAAFGIVVIVGLVYAFTNGKGSSPDSISDVPSTELSDGTGASSDEEDPYIYDENGQPIYSAETNQVVNSDSIDPGEADYSTSSKSKTTSKVFDTDDTLKDINGVDISATYNVTSRDYVYDYVSYVAKRGIIDDGMEIYWLEATYAGKKYRIQVPFYYFKDLNEEGVCRVQMEVLNIEGGGKVISYMQVVDNPKEQDAQE